MTAEEEESCPGGVCPVPWATSPAFAQEDDLLELDALSSKFNKNQISDYERPVLIDSVNHPSHYCDGSIECIEAIEAQLTPEEYKGFLRGNCAKYLWRCNNKGHTKQDLEKCQWYLNRLLMTFDD